MACSLCTLVLDNTKLLHSERKHKAFTHHYPFAQASALTIKRGPVRATKPHKLRDLAFKGTGIGYGDGLLFRRNVLSRALKGSEQVPDDGSESVRINCASRHCRVVFDGTESRPITGAYKSSWMELVSRLICSSAWCEYMVWVCVSK